MTEPLWRPCDQPRAEIGDLCWLPREFAEQPENRYPALCRPLFDGYAAADAWYRGDVRLHVKVWSRPYLPSGDECQLCIDLQRATLPRAASLRRRAVPRVRDFDVDPCGLDPEWADRPVLVARIDARKQHERMPLPPPRLVAVRLVATDYCEICSPDAGQPAGPTRRCI